MVMKNKMPEVVKWISVLGCKLRQVLGLLILVLFSACLSRKFIKNNQKYPGQISKKFTVCQKVLQTIHH
jgi:hypothetical protein